MFFADLNKQFTAMIYESISRSLFQDHVLVFSFILCVGILRQGGEINEDSWTCLLELAKPDSSHNTKSNEFFDLDKPFWLTERQWDQIHRASKRLDCLARCDKRHFDRSISCISKTGFIFVFTIFVQNEKWSPFLELTPTPLQMPRDVTNISED